MFKSLIYTKKKDLENERIKAIEKLVPLVGPDEEHALAMVWEGISLIRDDLTNENFNPKSAKKIKERIKRQEGDKKS